MGKIAGLDEHRQAPWRQVADLGNVLRHTYFAINPDVIWKIIQQNLRPLRAALMQLRASLEA
jgi:uncharacterized protein with HEPN domain